MKLGPINSAIVYKKRASEPTLQVYKRPEAHKLSAPCKAIPSRHHGCYMLACGCPCHTERIRNA